MSKNYHHLSTEQRYQIEALLENGINQKAIDSILQVHASRISRELKRNTQSEAVRLLNIGQRMRNEGQIIVMKHNINRNDTIWRGKLLQEI